MDMRTILDPLIVVKQEPEAEYEDSFNNSENYELSKNNNNLDKFRNDYHRNKLNSVIDGDFNNNQSDEVYKDGKCM